MRTIQTSEEINRDRRRLLDTATMGIAAGAACLLPAHPAAAAEGDAIQPFRIEGRGAAEARGVSGTRRVSEPSAPSPLPLTERT